MAATLLCLLVSLLVVVAAVHKSERRQDYGDYGGDDVFLNVDTGEAGFAFAESFGGKKQKDPFAAIYGGPAESGEGEEELYSAFAYDEGGDEDVYYDVDYEGSEKKEKKQKQDRKSDVNRKSASTKGPETKKQDRTKKAPTNQGPR